MVTLMSDFFGMSSWNVVGARRYVATVPDCGDIVRFDLPFSIVVGESRFWRVCCLDFGWEPVCVQSAALSYDAVTSSTFLAVIGGFTAYFGFEGLR